MTASAPSRGFDLGVNFHGVGSPERTLEDGEASVWATPDEMESILDRAVDHSNVYLTSDDGNISDLRLLMPAMCDRSLVGTFFVLTGRIGRRGSLGERDIQELVAAGMSVGLHGDRHVSWRGLRPADRRVEWIESKDRLEQISGCRVTEAACPFGSYDRSVVTGLKSLGFERVYTSDGGWGSTTDFVAPRNSVGTGSGKIDAAGLDSLLARPGIDGRTRLKRWIKRWR